MKAVLARVPGGATVILLATAVAGGAGYVVNAVVPATVSTGEYAEFSVLWSMLDLLVAVLAGVQQEVTRAARPVGDGVTGDARPARWLALWGALAAGLAVLAVGVPLVRAVLGTVAYPAAPALAVAAAGYVVVAVAAGLLSGVERWRTVALMMTVDGLLRVVLVGVLLVLGAGVGGLMWGVAAPFPLALLLLLPRLRAALAGRVAVHADRRALAWNAGRAVLAAAAGGLLISGFPLLLALTSPDTGRDDLAGVNLAINLVRAPLVVVAVALQGFLVVRFRAAGPAAGELLARVGTAVAAVSVVAAGAAALVGPPVLARFGPAYDLPAWFLAVLVAGSGALGALCASGALLLARSRHGGFLLGWAVAAAVTVAALLLPLDLQQRVTAALVAGPVVGLLTHLASAAEGTRSGRFRP